MSLKSTRGRAVKSDNRNMLSAYDRLIRNEMLARRGAVSGRGIDFEVIERRPHSDYEKFIAKA